MGGAMISPHTPPGTKVVCVDDVLSARLTHGIPKSFDLHGIKKDEVYTVRDIVEDECSTVGFSVRLMEIYRPDDVGYSLLRFRLLDLPKSITSCLTSQPLLVDELTGEAPGDKCAPPVVTARGLR
jgi:hypothetical protein